MGELPTGTVTLLLADIEGSTRLWETRPAPMAEALTQLQNLVERLIADYGGVRPVEQGEGDSFVVAFARASDAVACALQLQLNVPSPIRIRIGLHTGEVELRGADNYAGSTVNRTARLRDLAHGGQTVLSGVTEHVVVDRLPAGVWLTDLGLHPLRDLARPERVVQLNHRDLANDFPPLRVVGITRGAHLPVQLTRFIGRSTQIDDVVGLLSANRLVTLTGAGGVGKTRLALRVADELADSFADGAWFVDLAPVTEPDVVAVALARTLGLADLPGRSALDTVRNFVRDRTVLLVVDNCEHLLDVCSDVVLSLLDAGPGLKVLATSREPIGVSGELTWRVPSLPVHSEAVELFIDRVRRIRPDFSASESDSLAVADICRRLDGMPLAIELAAARTRTLSLIQIAEGLNRNFRLLAGGARNAVRRQQTLRASIDWSHTMLTEPERVVFRRLAVFLGGFDLPAALGVAAGSEAEQFQLIDLLGLLVDKSLVLAEDGHAAMRYRLLETVRQYGLEKLTESGEAESLRIRHRDYFTAAATHLAQWSSDGGTSLIAWAEVEIDNLRAAHAWSCETADFGPALRLMSALQQLWLTGGRLREGVAGFAAIFEDERYRDGNVEPAVWVRAVADYGLISVWFSVPFSFHRAGHALTTARRLEDRLLVAECLTTCGMLAFDQAELAEPFFVEAAELACGSNEQPQLYRVRAYQAFVGTAIGSPAAAEAAAMQGRELADQCGDHLMSRYSRTFLSGALAQRGKLTESSGVARSLVAEAHAAGDRPMETFGLITLAQALAWTGQTADARVTAEAAVEISSSLGGFHEDTAWVTVANAALARGDAVAALEACHTACRLTYPLKELFTRSLVPMSEASLACGDLIGARRWADDTVAVAPGCHGLLALTARARVALAQGDFQRSQSDLYEALAVAERTGGRLNLPDAFECLAALAVEGNPEHAARLLGVAHVMRQRYGQVRFPIFQADYDLTMSRVREHVDVDAFNAVWLQGSSLSTAEAITYAHRGRGARGRPTSGWESLTPTERDVVRLVREGLSNKGIAARLFVSPRTVQSHLTHIYAKLGVTSRLQLVREAAQHA